MPDSSSRRSVRKRLLIAAGALVAVVLLGFGVLVGRVWWKLNQIPETDVASLDEAAEGPKNFLIVGSDSREAIDANDPNAALFLGGGQEPAGQRADTMVVLRFDEEIQKLDVLSIPRDLWVPIAGTGENERINTAYSGEDGPDTLVRTIQDYLGIPIHHYAQVDFLGFQDLVDQLGGIDMYFNSIYQDTHSGLVVSEPGCVTMDGHMALAFVRSRNLEYLDVLGEWQSDPTGDLGRISRQQIFLRNALGKAKGRLSVTNVAELPDLIDVAVDHVTIDSGLSPNDLLNMMQRYAEFEGENIDTYTLPSEPYTTSGGAAVLQLDLAGAQPTLDIFRDESAGVVDVTSVDSIELTILNGSGVRRQAGEAQAALEDAGFVIIEVGDVFRPEGENLEATLIRYGPGAQEQAALVERHLAAGGELVFDELLVSGEIVLETGVDFTGVNRTPRPPPTASTVAGATSTSSTTSTTTTTVPVGRTPGEPPEGTECG